MEKESVRTVIFVAGRRPEPAMEREMIACGLEVHWARSIQAAADLLTAALESTVIVSELALVDGNWRDLVETVKRFERTFPIVLVTSSSTAELWWDALDCGVLDMLPAPLSASRLCQLLARHFNIAKSLAPPN